MQIQQQPNQPNQNKLFSKEALVLGDSRSNPLAHSLAIAEEFSPELSAQVSSFLAKLAFLEASLSGDPKAVIEAATLLNRRSAEFLTVLAESEKTVWTESQFSEFWALRSVASQLEDEANQIAPDRHEALVLLLQEMVLIADSAYTLGSAVLAQSL